MSHGHDSHSGHDTKSQYEHQLVEHDSWFRHDENEPRHKAASGSTNPVVIIAFLLGTMVFVFAVGILCIEFLGSATRGIRQESQERNATYVAEVRQARADWDAKLKNYEWIDSNAGKVRIPIEKAKAMVIADYAAAKGGK